MPVSSKKLRSNHEWIERHLSDRWVKQSRKDGYRARSAYKLLQINEKFRFFRPGAAVADLGAAPGSWSQAARTLMTGPDGVFRGSIVALDILPMEPLPDVLFIQGDFREEEVCARLADALGGRTLDVVMSDMAPNLSGIAASDQMRSMHLCELALLFAGEHLAPGGAFITKAFQGSGYPAFLAEVRKSFARVQIFKPEASRNTSSEQYIVARGLKAAGATGSGH